MEFFTTDKCSLSPKKFACKRCGDIDIGCPCWWPDHCMGCVTYYVRIVQIAWREVTRYRHNVTGLRFIHGSIPPVVLSSTIHFYWRFTYHRRWRRVLDKYIEHATRPDSVCTERLISRLINEQTE